MIIKDIWAKVRPYFTIERVVIPITGLVTPPLALFAGWLSTQAAQWGYNPDPAQLTATFVAGVIAVVAIVVPLLRAFIDNRTKTAQALISVGRADLIGAKSIASQVAEGANAKDFDPATLSEPRGVNEAGDVEVDDISPEDADDPDAPPRSEREVYPEP